ncbi:MAG: HD domain-containing phosphohydrolase [Gemmatimonadota bacterium]
MSADRSHLRALLVEDNPDDAALVLHALRRGGFDVEHLRVETAEDLRDAIARGSWDIVIADYTLPAFTGPQAFVIARQEKKNLPFILVSGAVGEETVVEAMRQGIDDYLMKDNLRRLPGAVERAIQACQERKGRKQAEEAILRRDAILLAVGLAAKRLLAAEDWRDEIDKVLAELGRAADVGRAYLFSMRSEGHVLATQQAEWVAPEVKPRSDSRDFQDFDMEGMGFGAWADAFSEGRPIHGFVRDFPPEVRSHLDSWDVTSIAIMPIMVEGTLWGTIGFDVCHAEREWSTVEVEALGIAADTMGAAIKRAKAKAHLGRQVEHLNALRRIDRAIANSLDLQLTLDVVLDQVMAQLGVEAASVLLLNPDTQQFEYTAGRGAFESAFRVAHVRTGEGHAGRAILDRRPVQVPDLRAASAEGSRESLLPRGLASYYALPLIAKNEVKGVLETFCGPSVECTEEWRDFAATLAGQAAIAIDNAQMLAQLTQSNTDLRLAYETTLEGWSRALDLRDNDTQGHTARVAALTVLLARAMGMDPEAIVQLRRGALLHDIGKMGIPDAILHKPGPLTDEEWEVMRRHPVYAYELLSAISYLRPALDIPHLHHERWDGSGYPLGLKSEEIPLAARVFAVVDTWDALTSNRPYRAKVAEDRAREIIRDGSGKDFDPRVVEAFLRLDLSQGVDTLRMAGLQ